MENLRLLSFWRCNRSGDRIPGIVFADEGPRNIDCLRSEKNSFYLTRIQDQSDATRFDVTIEGFAHFFLSGPKISWRRR